LALRITLLGKGAWGGTLAALWRQRGHHLRIWSRRDGGDAVALLDGAELVVAAVPMAAVAPLARSVGSHWPADCPLLSCSKGIDPESGGTASHIWQSHLPPVGLAVLSGPNLATELARGLPAASVIASRSQTLAEWLQQELSVPNLRLYRNLDPVGTEAAGALKNVMAIAAGVSDGLGLGANARASLLCRGLAEIGTVLEAMGGHPSTLYGLAGLGDLLATATSALSRNYRCGLLLAEGLEEAAALGRIGATVEGPRTARATLMLAHRHGWRLPICEQVVRLLAGEVEAADAVRSLMERHLRSEGGR
jgi:glycerol-3-phosphate dehydrogenase (NAD(P)+)